MSCNNLKNTYNEESANKRPDDVSQNSNNGSARLSDTEETNIKEKSRSSGAVNAGANVSENSALRTNLEKVPDDFFDDLLANVDSLRESVGLHMSSSKVRVKRENPDDSMSEEEKSEPENYYNDLVGDHVAARLEELHKERIRKMSTEGRNLNSSENNKNDSTHNENIETTSKTNLSAEPQVIIKSEPIDKAIVQDAEHANVDVSMATRPITHASETATGAISDHNLRVVQANAQSIHGAVGTEVPSATVHVKREISNDGYSPANIESDEEALPPENFFDDLLRDPLLEHRSEQVTRELEIKYSEKLKELERLQNEDQHKKAHKKHKKSKKKSHKRIRERRNSSEEQSRSSSLERNGKRSRLSRSPTLENTKIAPAIKVRSMNNLMKEPTMMPIKSEIIELANNSATSSLSTNDDTAIHPNRASNTFDDVQEDRTLYQRREKSVKSASALLAVLKDTETLPPLSNFKYTPAIRVSTSKIMNRTPLRPANNVTYFQNINEISTNLREMGLEPIPRAANKVAEAMGLDADNFYATRQTTKFPVCLHDNYETLEFNEKVDPPICSFFKNAMTQTDDAGVDTVRSKNSKSISVQVSAICGSIGTQTIDVQKSNDNKNNDLPLMEVIRDFNSNQLMVLHDLAELIKEQSDGNHAMDMYRCRQRIVDILKSSQLFDAPQPPIMTQQEFAHIPAPYVHSVNEQMQAFPRVHAAQKHRDPRYRNQPVHIAESTPYAQAARPTVMSPHNVRPPAAPMIDLHNVQPMMPANVTSFSPVPYKQPTKYYGRGNPRR